MPHPFQPPETATSVSSEALFQTGGKRPVKSLAGIGVDMIVRMVEVEGDLSLHGDIPDDVLVVVKGGGIWVSGYVAGHTVSDMGIAVQGNVAGGYVIARQGAISVTGGVLANSVVIALAGPVHAARVEGPRCLFGWCGVEVAGEVRGGRLLGASIDVGGEASGAELHVAGSLRSGAIATSPRGPSVVCLRQSISCEDYGRPQSEEERRISRAIGKHVYQASLMGRLLRYATRDIQDSQRTVLYILLGGQLNAQRVRQLRGLQCQNNFITEILAYADRIVETAQRMVRNPVAGVLDEIAVLADEVAEAAKTLEEDTRSAATIFSMDYRGNIVSACGELQQWAATMKKEAGSRSDWRPFLNAVSERRVKWRDLSDTLRAAIAEQVSAFGLKTEVVAAAESQPEKVDSMLQQVVAKLAEDPRNERFLRLRSPVVRLINTQVERHRKNMVNWRKVMEVAQAEIAAIQQTLGLTAASLFAEAGRDKVRASAGRFDAESVIVANPAPMTDPLQTAASLVRLSAAIDGPTTFVMNQGVLQRQTSA